MSRFIWETNERLVTPEATLRPRTTKDLLRALKVDDASDDVKYQAVKFWMYTHQPDPLLRMSLVQSGFAPDVTPFGEQLHSEQAKRSAATITT